MWARKIRTRHGHLGAFGLALVLLASVFVFAPDFPERGMAIPPNFTRPNVLVDDGAGWAGTAWTDRPVIASGIGGTLHTAWSDNRTGTDRGIYYAQSSDGGATWTVDKRIDATIGSQNQAPSIAVDTTAGPYSGNIYVVWQVNSASLADIYVTSSTDGGNTWRPKARVDLAPAGTASIMPRVAVDTDSKVYVVYQDMRAGGTNSDVYTARSDDGGASWGIEYQVSTGTNSDSFPSLAAYGGVVYAAWQEAISTSSNLWLAYSTTGGSSWTLNSLFSISSPGESRFVSIAVDTAGTLHAAWIMKDVAGQAMVAYSQSANRGVTWSPLARVDDATSAPTSPPVSANMIVSSGILYVVWTDTRNVDSDTFASWSEDNGLTWGDGTMNSNDVRVDDTDDNGVSSDDLTDQCCAFAASGSSGIYVVWSDKRNLASYHVYFASFEISAMLITEVQDAPNGMEQVELFNYGGKVIDLTGWTLSVDGAPVDLTPLGAVPPGTYVTIGDPGSSSLVSDITLGDESGTVRLIGQLGAVRDLMAYGLLGPTPDPLSSESVARVQAGVGYSDSWSRATTPTFGLPNGGMMPATIRRVVLNEVLFNTANPDDRFIELYFGGSGSIDLTGFVLVGDAPYALPAVTLSSLDPYLITRPSQAPSLFSLLDSSGDNLYLYDPLGSLVDMVGWSSLHSQGASMVRVPDGYGTPNGYDDVSSIAAGWRFDQVPSLPLVLIGPKQTKGGELGESLPYNLTVTNKEPASMYVNIEPQLGSQAWPVTLFQADGITPLFDSPGDTDNIPDVGLLSSNAAVNITVFVQVPSTPPAQDWEISLVVATAATDPLASAAVALTTVLYPYEFPSASLYPASICIASAPPTCQPKETTITLNVTGRGMAILTPRPQDTVMMIDSTGSMMLNDPSFLRRTAAKHYVDLLAVPDRAAVVDFDLDAVLVNGNHLSSNYVQIKANIDTIDSIGGTDLVNPIHVATDELVNYGNVSHLWVGILLTDGYDENGNSDAEILAEAQRAADNGIVIFTIGLVGTGNIDEALLRDIANLTGGTYMRAQTANDLDAIFQLIGKMVKNLAGYDNDVTDDIPMISVFLPNYINYVAGSASPAPGYVGSVGGRMNLQWNLSRLNINETWTATFDVNSSLAGPSLDALSDPDSRVTYIRHDNSQVSIPFPNLLIDVYEPPPPPPPKYNYTITRSPLLGNVTVDGVEYPANATFSWPQGERHSVSVPSDHNVTLGERWAFDFWDDGGSIAHYLIVANHDATITAYYIHQYKPAVTLEGLDGAHAVTARFTSGKAMVSKPGLYGTWSDWVDNGTPLSFSALGANSDSKERWITLEDFSAQPWNSVTSAFSRTVLYWRQVAPSVVLQGLPSTRTVPVVFTKFASVFTVSSYSSWADWVDYSTSLTVGGKILIPPSERYMNMLSKNQDLLQWNVISAVTYVVPFVHQFKPAVFLLGTDSNHTVYATYTDSTREQPLQTVTGLTSSWSDWADVGTNVMFPNQTTGSPPHSALNDTTLLVDSAFVALIVYAPPPPINIETNFKPLISIAFVVLLLISGLFWGNRKPWDRYIPPPKGEMRAEELAARKAKLKRTPVSEKLALFDLRELQEKFQRDRNWTMSVLTVPFATVEALIGVASFFTGFLKVPEAGNWLSLGLAVNSLLLIAGLCYHLLIQRKGYKVPGEEQLAKLKPEKAGQKTTAKSPVAPAPPSTKGKPEQKDAGQGKK